MKANKAINIGLLFTTDLLEEACKENWLKRQSCKIAYDEEAHNIHTAKFNRPNESVRTLSPRSKSSV
jgi:hypothetical protein